MIGIISKITLVAMLLGALFYTERHIEQRGYLRAASEFSTAIEAQKNKASQLLAEETARANAAEAALQAFRSQQELKDTKHEKTVADLQDRLHRLAGPIGRLFDPNAPGCGAGGGVAQSGAATAPGTRSADATQAGGLLSKELSGLLQRLQLEADTINIAYASCRADAYAVRPPP